MEITLAGMSQQCLGAALLGHESGRLDKIEIRWPLTAGAYRPYLQAYTVRSDKLIRTPIDHGVALDLETAWRATEALVEAVSKALDILEGIAVLEDAVSPPKPEREMRVFPTRNSASAAMISGDIWRR